ncbi:MAG: thioredoxin family protein [Spirochaetales bacterium]|nr:thioredoxin family protein [Spirochaetales bacterium]
MKVLETREEFDALVNSDGNTCFLFTADWCPDCHAVKPVMPVLEEEFKGSFDFVTVDRDRFIEICQEKNVFGIPSFLTYSKGEETGRFVSKDAKTKEEIDEFLRKAAAS